MKRHRLPSICSVAGLLACSTLGAADSAAGHSTPAAPWRYGFETTEGSIAGQSAQSTIINATGGTAVVVAGGAGEGEQFLRFVPDTPEAALVVTLPESFLTATERSAGFAIRLPAGSATTRLVLSYGGTVALRPVANGVEISAGADRQVTHLQVLTAGEWFSLAVTENLAAKTWRLSVGGRVVADGLPMTPAPGALSNVLLFADGALDLDSLVAGAGGNVAAGEGEPRGGAAGRFSADERSRLLGRAVEAARGGDFAMARDVAKALARDAGHAAGGALVEAQFLVIMAYALRDSGLHEPAAELGREALRVLEQGKLASPAARAADRATIEFTCAQISEQLLGDWTEAERLYSVALSLDPTHKGAEGAGRAIARKRESERLAMRGGAQ